MPLVHLIPFPVVNMREAPQAQSKIVSQALFGEEVKVKGQEKNWSLISTPDGYLGWIESTQIIQRSPYQKNIEVSRLGVHLYAEADTEYGPLMTLPFGSGLQSMGSDERWHQVKLPDEKEGFIQTGDVAGEPFDLLSFSQKFLGLPYTWGGRSSFGYDCSGFVQMLYARLGRLLPRDAREQIFCGKEVPLKELSLSDLIFWGKSAEEIKHVGMSLDNEKFIHTSTRENKPYLRISSLSDFEWSGSKEAFYPFRTARRIN